MNKKERKTAAVMGFLRRDEFGSYSGLLQNLEYARICDCPQGIAICLDSVPFEIRILSSDTVEIKLFEMGVNELFAEGGEFIFPYTVKVNALKDRETLIGDIKLVDYDRELGAHYIDYSTIIKCGTLWGAVEAGRKKLKEVEHYLEKVVSDYRPKLKDFPDKLYTPEEYIKQKYQWHL